MLSFNLAPKNIKKYTHIGAYALIKKEENLLFIKKSRGPYKGKWDLPGGGFEFCESSEETLKREIKEETGLIVVSYKLIDVLSNVVIYQNADQEKEKMHHIGVLYSVEVDCNINDLKNCSDNEDSLGAKWLPISCINSDNFLPFSFQSKKYV